MCLHELIFHPHIEEDHTNMFRFIRKINLIKKNLRKLRFKIFAVTMGRHCNSKKLKSQFSQIFLYKIDFSYKTEHISMILLYMWTEDELMKIHLTALTWIFLFYEIFPIVIPIVLQKCGATPEFSL